MKCVYSVHDLKSGYGHPHLANNNPDAIRQFTMAIQNDPNSLYKKFPADFVLVKIGEFDPSTGAIIPLDRPEIVCQATDLIEN